MDMVLVLDMLASAILVLAMLGMVMDTLPTDIPPLDTMAKDQLMLSLKLRPMLVFTMEDMDMVLDMQVLDILPMDTPLLDIMARDLLMPSQKLRLMPDSIMEDMDMVLDMLVSDMLVSVMLDTDMDTLPTDIPPLDTTVRDLLMLSQKPRLMLDSTMEDMEMVLAMLVSAMLVLAMLDTDMDTLPT